MEEPIVGVTRNGFSVPEMTIMEGQSIIFVWHEQTEPVDVVQVRSYSCFWSVKTSEGIR